MKREYPLCAEIEDKEGNRMAFLQAFVRPKTEGRPALPEAYRIVRHLSFRDGAWVETWKKTFQSRAKAEAFIMDKVAEAEAYGDKVSWE